MHVYPIINEWSLKKGYVAAVNWRSSHQRPVPTTGGLIFLLTPLITVFFIQDPVETFAVLLCSFAIILGWLDDRKDIKWYYKLLGQLSIGIGLYLTDYSVSNLHGIFGIYELNEMVSILLTALIIAATMNAINLIDGVDGLAGLISVVFFGFFVVWFFINGSFFWSIYSCIILASLLAFLKFNFNPAKTFMGDTGALFLGANTGLFLIIFLKEPVNQFTLVPFSIIALPLVDMLRVFIHRIMEKKSPFYADKKHYHHLLIAAGSNHKEIALSGFLLSILYGVLAFILLSNLRFNAAFILIICFIISGYIWVNVRVLMHYYMENEELQKTKNDLSRKNNLLTHKFKGL